MDKKIIEFIGRFAVVTLAASGLRVMDMLEWILFIIFLIIGFIWVGVPLFEIKKIKNYLNKKWKIDIVVIEK